MALLTINEHIKTNCVSSVYADHWTDRYGKPYVNLVISEDWLTDPQSMSIRLTPEQAEKLAAQLALSTSNQI